MGPVKGTGEALGKVHIHMGRGCQLLQGELLRFEGFRNGCWRLGMEEGTENTPFKGTWKAADTGANTQ